MDRISCFGLTLSALLSYTVGVEAAVSNPATSSLVFAKIALTLLATSAVVALLASAIADTFSALAADKHVFQNNESEITFFRMIFCSFCSFA
eukprot:COSAG05_NODE_209_length_14039_cov_138.574892_3_plen_92_part_00